MRPTQCPKPSADPLSSHANAVHDLRAGRFQAIFHRLEQQVEQALADLDLESGHQLNANFFGIPNTRTLGADLLPMSLVDSLNVQQTFLSFH